MTPLELLNLAKGSDERIVRAILSVKHIVLAPDTIHLIVEECAKHRYVRVLSDFLEHDLNVNDVKDALDASRGWVERVHVLRNWANDQGSCDIEWTDVY